MNKGAAREHDTPSKRKKIREDRRRREKNQRVLLIAIVAVFAVAIAALLIIPNLPKPVSNIVLPTFLPAPQENFNSLGDPKAPVKIVEYSDFQCPFCANFWKDTEAQIISTYVATGKVYLTYKSAGNFVSDNINASTNGNNQESQLAAQAAYCAGDQTKFWQYHDVLFANQGTENTGILSRSFLDAVAQKLNLDTNMFKGCMDSGKYAARVKQDSADFQADATAAPNYDKTSGLATPSFFINGNITAGALPFSQFQQMIDLQLAAKK